MKWGRACGGGRKETGSQIWMPAGSGCRDSGKVLANASSREEVGSLAFSLPFPGFPERNFRGEGLECRLGSLRGTTAWWRQIAHATGARGRALLAAEADCHQALGPGCASPSQEGVFHVCPPLAKVSPRPGETHGIDYRSHNLWLGKVSP